MSSTKSQKIITGIIAGDSLILKEFYKKNLPYVRKYILLNRGSIEDVEDIFQEALVLVYHKLRNKKLDLQVSADSYFIGVCKNLWKNQLRKQKILTYQESQIDFIPDTSISIIDTMTLRSKQELYQKYFTKLNENNKELLSLFFEGKSMNDIATNIGYTKGYTRKKKYIIKNCLLKMIQSDPVYVELVKPY